MASKFKIGDLVWAKLKGFQAWPGKVIEAKPDVKRPSDKKKQFVFFFGSENYAWIPDDQMWSYTAHKDKFMMTSRVPKGFKEAVEAMEDVVKTMPQPPVKTSELPSIDDELAAIRSPGSRKEYSRHSLSKAKSKSVGRASRTAENGKAQTVSNALDKVSSSGSDRARSGRKREEKVKAATPTTEKKHKESKSTPKLPLKKRPASPGSSTSSTTPTAKRSRLLVKVSPKPQGFDAFNSAKKIPIYSNSVSPPAKEKTEKVASTSTVVASASSSSPTSLGNMIKAAKTEITPILDSLNPEIQGMSEPIMMHKNVIPTPLKIGFLGLGLMGSGMVGNLLRSGHEVTVWNRTPSKCKEFVKEGALKGNSPAEVVQSCDITFSCVSDPTALKDLVFGNCGVLQGIGQGKAYIDMSTVDVETITDVHEAVTARGGRFLEAPVIGSRQPSQDGRLLVLAAGDRSLYEDCYSCFEAMGRKTFYLGEIGSAAKMTLVVNMLIGTVLAGLAESLALAEKVGLDQDEVLQILSLSPINCPFIRNKGTAMILSNYSDPDCKLHVYQKDLRLAVNMSDTVDQPLHVGSAVNELFKKAKAKGYGEHDTAAVYRAADL